MEKTTKTQRLVESGVMIALAAVLSELKIQLPLGGGITVVSMLPIILLSYRHGAKWGLMSAFVYSVIQCLIGIAKGTVTAFFLPEAEGGDGFSLIVAICIVLLDYILAYTALGLGGIFKNKVKSAPLGLCLGSIVAVAVRFLMHFVSGWIFYGVWADWFFGQEELGAFGQWILEHLSGQGLAAFYSFFYNGMYMIPELIITAVIACAAGAVPVISGRKNIFAKKTA